ncbi:hypothetical protein Phum_PHUM401010 [Pediculus humanus corporis]|uniref:Uncharacterized protein n=1 Tax=Pediculus humanus subsp. corporis TaxID=121224 RepID=E0VRP9_PEDHC|nr:uncharacterized protein Phum_PHUM401010 [Pediculus humanus corporis]EEB16055.1 hypothetical protein Phum_PHUM401010 [Pediculus humanus corporis]
MAFIDSSHLDETSIYFILKFFLNESASRRQSILQQYRQHAGYTTQEEIDTTRFRIVWPT